MGNTHEKLPDSEDSKMVFDWNAFMQFLYARPGETDKIGRAWPLFFDICSNLDRAGIHSGTYQDLARRYQVAPITVKKWRRHLGRHSVIESFNRGHSIIFRLTEPYLSFLKPLVRKEKTGADGLLFQAILKAIKDESFLKAA